MKEYNYKSIKRFDKFGIDADVIPFGAVDARLEAIKLMEEEVKGYILWDWEK